VIFVLLTLTHYKIITNLNYHLTHNKVDIETEIGLTKPRRIHIRLGLISRHFWDVMSQCHTHG